MINNNPFGTKVDQLSNEIIDRVKDDDDQFALLAGIISNLATYMAETD